MTNFIKVPTMFHCEREEDGYTYVHSSTLQFVVGETIPVIEAENSRCVGLGKIIGVYHVLGKTKIEFELLSTIANDKKEDKIVKRYLYQIYRMNIGNLLENSDDEYEDSKDMYIPGHYRAEDEVFKNMRTNHDSSLDLDDSDYMHLIKKRNDTW